MKPTLIKFKKSCIERRINEASLELKELQEVCPHENHEKSYRANTGNYDPHANEYWIHRECNDCGKIWNTIQ